MKKVGYDGLRNLKVDQELLLKAGKGEHRSEAKVKVAEQPGSGSTGCMVEVLSFDKKGSKVNYAEGNIILGGANELYLP